MSFPARTRARGGSYGVAAPHWGPHPIGGEKGEEPTVDHFCGYLHQNNPAASTGVGIKMRRTFPRYPPGPLYNTTGGTRRAPRVYNTSARS